MGFAPPRCPNRSCEHHEQPKTGFFVRRGSYQPRCRTEPVPRFCCRGCGKGFSRQTFRHDYRDRRPACNGPLFDLLCSGVGFRQAGRLLQLDVHSVQGKARKMARTCGPLHENLGARLPEGRSYVLDEEETFEGASIRPLTMPVLIEQDSWFVVGTAVGPIRRLARRGTRRRRLQDRAEQEHGRRPDRSAACVRAVLEQLRQRLPAGPLLLRSDQKASYCRLLRSVFGDRAQHVRISGRLQRGTHNPLFPINTTLAMTRDNMGRLRRRSWLVTKQAACLQLHLHLFTVYRNYVRRRFNRDARSETPACHLKLLPRQMHTDEVLAWRQDWGPLSIHPLSHDAAHTVAQPFPLAA